MEETKAGPSDTTAEAPPTLAEYKNTQAHVKELTEKRRLLEKSLADVETSIQQRENQYLESTPGGNIITGFDNYMKGASGTAAQRRRTGPPDQNRVFSQSSVSYRPNNSGESTPGSTPAPSHAPTPTPIATSFRESASGQPTPTSASGTKTSIKLKKKEKETEDSETDGQANKKRTNFGASRK